MLKALKWIWFCLAALEKLLPIISGEGQFDLCLYTCYMPAEPTMFHAASVFSEWQISGDMQFMNPFDFEHRTTLPDVTRYMYLQLA